MYKLLPFYFTRILEKEVLVNEIGDMLILPSGSVKDIIEKKLNESNELYKTLHANFFISDEILHPLFEVYASRLAAKKRNLESRASLHIFVLTLRCNQNCSYCQASSRDVDSCFVSMSKHTMAKAVDLMFQSDSDNITMEFQGGEPSLEFDLIKYGVYRALSINEKVKKDLSIVLCTNCISLTDELLTFCKEHSILISSSLDGPKELHDKNRGKVGSYEKVIAGFQKVRQILGKDALSALMTTSVYSLNYPKEIVDEYIQQGFSGIFIRSLNPYGQAIDGTNWDKYTNDFIIFYKKALDYIISINEKGYYFREEFAAIILRKMLTPTDGGFVDLLSPSGVVNSVIVYHYDGNVYCSDESRMLSEMGDYTFMLGSVDDEYESLVYGDKIKEIANVWANECLAGCSDCAFKTYCGADPVRNYSTQHDMYGNRPHSNWCKKNKAIITYLIELIIERPQIVLPIFKKWII